VRYTFIIFLPNFEELQKKIALYLYLSISERYLLLTASTAKIWIGFKNKKNRKSLYTLRSCWPIIPVGLYSRSIETGWRRHGEMEGKIILGKGSRRGRTDEPGRFSGRYQRGTCSSFSRALNRLPLAEGKKVGDREKWTRRAEGLVRSAGAWAPDILRAAQHSSSSF